MRKTEEGMAAELSDHQKVTNRDYAAQQAAKENSRIPALKFDDTRVENTHINLADDKKVSISMGQGGRPYQQDRFDAQTVNELTKLTPTEISTLLYQTGLSFGEEYADVFGHGSTANVVAYAQNTLITMNLGDTRSIIIGPEQLQLSYDHKPSFKPEAARVEREGGIINRGQFVKIDQEKKDNTDQFYKDIEPRGIAITRTIGNSKYYPGKSHIPSMTEFPIATASKENTLLVIASDGLWDFVSGTNMQQLKEKGLAPDEIANEARRLAYQRSPADATGKKLADNCTVLVSPLFENAVYAVFDGHGNRNTIVDALREQFILRFRRLAHQYILDKGEIPPALPEDEYAQTQPLSSQDWEASPEAPNSPEPEIFNPDESAAAGTSAKNPFKLENEHKRKGGLESDKKAKKVKEDTEEKQRENRI